MVTKGVFIVFEGIDGSGTSTQAGLLHTELVKRRVRTALTSEPTAGPVGHMIREINTGRVHVSRNREIVDRHMAYLFAADRFDHLYNDSDGILARVAQGFVVISTRYYLSSFAYNTPCERDFELVDRLNADFPPADLTIYFDCSVDIAFERISRAGRTPDRNETTENLSLVSEKYERVLSSHKGLLFRLDATCSPNELHKSVLSVVEDTIPWIAEKGTGP